MKLPKAVTHAQMLAASEVLGLDPRDVTHFQVDATDGVIVVVRARTPEGNIPVAADNAVTITHHIPIDDRLDLQGESGGSTAVDVPVGERLDEAAIERLRQHFRS